MDIFGDLSREQLKATKEIGYSLKEKRENLGYTLDHISSIIRISVYTIQQLEEGNYSFFKNMVFLKGSLRNYCNFMKVDPTPFLEKIDKLFIVPSIATVKLKGKNVASLINPFFVNLVVSFFVVSLIATSIYFLFFNNFGKQDALVIQDRSLKPATQKAVPAVETKLTLSISAHKDGWARITTSKNKVFEIYLKEQVSYNWVVKENFTLVLATRDLASVFLNEAPAIVLLTDEQDTIATFTIKSF